MRALVLAALLAAGCGGCIAAIEGEEFTLLDEPALAQTTFINAGQPVYPTGTATVEKPPRVPRTRPVNGGAP